jgi:hypothetical protein
VASRVCSRTFGKLVAAEAYARGGQAAPRRAFLGDGLAYNWAIQRAWFGDWEAILDFIHPLTYLYLAAGVVAGAEGRWGLYVGWLTACWQGRVGEVVEQLRAWQAGAGPAGAEAGTAASPGPPGAVAERDPGGVVARVGGYLGRNAARMAYPRYRQAGLPVTSSAVESLIKEFNYRVKGTEKFWNDPAGAEAILQVRAAVLSDDGRLGRHIHARPGNPYRRPASAQGRQDRQARDSPAFSN